jgi:hypothetical protein
MEKKLSEVEKEKFLKLVVSFANKEENEDFKYKLLEKLSGELDFLSIQKDVSFIKKATARLLKENQLQGDASVDYSWVEDEYVRNQLIVDNFRMGTIYRRGREQNHFEMFYNYCSYAFFQIEELTNYFLHEMATEVEEFISVHNTDCEPKYLITRAEDKVIAHIMNQKINYLLRKYPVVFESIIYTLRSIQGARNEGLHRCSVTFKMGESHDKLVRFLRYQNYDSVLHAIAVVNQFFRIELAKKKTQI